MNFICIPISLWIHMLNATLFNGLKAQVKVTIEETLDQGLPATYDQTLFTQKCEAVYQHVYDSYFGQGRSIYEHVA